MNGVVFATTLALVTLAGVIGLGWLYRRKSVLFTVRVQPDRVRVNGQLPPSRLRAIRDYFEEESETLGLQRVRIRGFASPNRKIRLVFSGSISAHSQQRVRNFILNVAK